MRNCRCFILTSAISPGSPFWPCLIKNNNYNNISGLKHFSKKQTLNATYFTKACWLNGYQYFFPIFYPHPSADCLWCCRWMYEKGEQNKNIKNVNISDTSVILEKWDLQGNLSMLKWSSTIHQTIRNRTHPDYINGEIPRGMKQKQAWTWSWESSI